MSKFSGLILKGQIGLQSSSDLIFKGNHLNPTPEHNLPPFLVLFEHSGSLKLLNEHKFYLQVTDRVWATGKKEDLTNGSNTNRYNKMRRSNFSIFKKFYFINISVLGFFSSL